MNNSYFSQRKLDMIDHDDDCVDFDFYELKQMKRLTSTDEDVKYNYNVHDHLQDLSVAQLKTITEQDRLPYGVAVINLDGSLNVGIIIRTACLLGAERVLVFGRRKYDRRSCVGSHNYIPVERVDGYIDNRVENPEISATKFIDVMDYFNYCPLFMETGGRPVNDIKNVISKLDYIKPCIVLGSESNGIPNVITNSYAPELKFSIPQLGVIRSFNVSAAGSIAMWEMYNILK